MNNWVYDIIRPLPITTISSSISIYIITVVSEETTDYSGYETGSLLNKGNINAKEKDIIAIYNEGTVMKNIYYISGPPNKSKRTSNGERSNHNDSSESLCLNGTPEKINI